MGLIQAGGGWAIVILLFPTSNPPDLTKNQGCKNPETAVILCDKAYELFDQAVHLDRALDVCEVEKERLEEKLEIRTSSITHTIQTEESIPWWVIVIGGVLLGGGITIGATF